MIDTLIRVRSNPFNTDCFDLGTGFRQIATPIASVIDFDRPLHIDELTLDSSSGSLFVCGRFDNYNGSPLRPITGTTSTNNSNYSVIKLLPSGQVDNSFFNYGFETTGFTEDVSSLEIQSDGKIVVGGDFLSYNGVSRNRICRLNSNGTLDTGFSVGTGFNGNVYDIEIQSDGKILVGGNFTLYSGISTNSLTRLTTGGTKDSTFSGVTSINGGVSDITIQSDGKILLAGGFTTLNGQSRFRRLARLNSDGTTDTSFSGFTTGFTAGVSSVSVQSDGKILYTGIGPGTTGLTFNNVDYPNKYIIRLNSDGSVDSTFMSNLPSNLDRIYDVKIQPNGKIVCVGVKISRLNTDGTLDTTFFVSTVGGGNQVSAEVTEIDNNGKIYVGGRFRDWNNGQNVNSLIRLNTDGTSNTCVTGNNQYLDLYDDVSITLNLSFAEIQDVSTKNSGYSQTFRIPGTPKNNKFFNYFFDVNADNLSFNAQETVPVSISYKGNNVLEGNLRLLKIYVNENGCDYEVNVQDEVGELISDISNKRLIDIDFSDLNHTYNSNNVTTSWNATYTGGTTSGGLLDGQILYPFSHNGYLYDKSGNTITSGSNASPLLELNGASGSISFSGTPMRTTGFRPNIQIKSILNRIFEQNNYQVESNFIDTEYFNRLYLPLMFNSETYYINSTGATDGTSTIIQSIDAPILGFDFNSIACGIGFYQEIFGDVFLDNVIQNNGPTYPTGGWFDNKFYAWSGGQYKFNYTLTLAVTGQSGNFESTGDIFLCKNNNTGTTFGQIPFQFSGPFAGQYTFSNTGIAISLAPGDYVTLVVRAIQSDAGCYGPDPVIVPFTKTNTFYGTVGSSVVVTEAPNLVIGSTVNINEQITPEYKQLDFLKGLMTQFNLVLVKHPYKTKTYILETYDDYVGQGIIYDWTHKIDKKKDIVVSPITNLVGKQINFEYQDDADALNTFTKSINNNRTFGTETFVPTNTKLNDQPMNIKSFFSPSPCDTLPFADTLPNPFIVPHFYGVKESTSNGVTKQQLLPMKLKPRILHYFGLQSTANTWYYLLDSSGTTQSYNVYPLIHHQDRIPSITDIGTARDLNFGNSSSPQDNVVSTFTVDTAYERYWSNYIEDLLDPDARLVTAYIDLDVEDIVNLEYKDLIFIKDTYYRINKISNFNIINKSTTQVELVKLLRVDLSFDCTIDADVTVISGTTDPCPSFTPTPTPTPTLTITPTVTPTPSVTPTLTPTQTITPTPEVTTTPTPTPTPTLTPTLTITPTITPTQTITPTITSTITPTPGGGITLFVSGVQGDCGDFCDGLTNYLINSLTTATNDYFSLSIGDTIDGLGGLSGWVAYSNVSTDTDTGPFRVAEVDNTGLVLDILVCSGIVCVPL